MPCLRIKIIVLLTLSLFPVQARSAEQKVSTPAAHRNFTDPTTGMEFIAIKGGCFLMGDSYGDGYTTEDGIPIEKPVHEVCISDFFMGKYEVTVNQFRKFVAETGYKTEAERNTGGLQGCYCVELDRIPEREYRSWASWKNPNKYLKTKDNHPVACVSSYDALAFAAWLKSKTSINYRLPTEAEWEYAARGGTTTRNHWGNRKDDACRYANVADQTKLKDGGNWPDRHNCNDGFPYVAPVGQFKPNNFGLYDMMGNVWEWVNDPFDSTYYKSSKRENPEGPKSGSTRVYRGGSWMSGPSDLRAAFRPNLQLGRRYYDVGFRLILPAQ